MFGKFRRKPAPTTPPNPFVAGMTSLGKAVRVSTTQSGADTGGGIATVICGVDLVRGGHHLGATPGLVKPDIADNVRYLQPAVAQDRWSWSRRQGTDCQAVPH